MTVLLPQAKRPLESQLNTFADNTPVNDTLPVLNTRIRWDLNCQLYNKKTKKQQQQKNNKQTKKNKNRQLFNKRQTNKNNVNTPKIWSRYVSYETGCYVNCTHGCSDHLSVTA